MDKSSSSNKKEERRMSSTGAFAGPSSKETSKENKRPLITVFSENKLGTNSTTTPGQVNDNNIGPSVSQKQSFLSRFASAEARSSIAAAAAAFDQFSPSPLGHKSSSTTTTTTTTTTKSNFVLPDTQCDNKSKPASLTLPISTESKSNEDVHEDDVNKHGPLQSTSKKTSEKVKEKQRIAEPSEHLQDNRSKEDNEDNDQVLPVWPSRIEARSMEPAGVQHQVYSLKDYSQVSGPTKQPTTQQPQTGGRLLKSMSQDRKIKSNAKRMSECIYSSQQNRAYMSVSGSNDNQKSLKQRNSTINDHILTSPGGSFSIQGPAASVNSPLAPTTKNTTLLSESRIDRMRKLFVSPLSLRSSASGSSKALGSHNQSADNPRLSFQAGANVLHKPHHHLMHAMYRTRAHHSRRSPMRQKQGATKGFRVYGCPLQMANNIYPITCFGRPDIYKQQSVPYILVRLCNYIEETSSHLTHEGIFRVSGNARLMEKLRTLFDRLGDAPLESESVDVATSASMLKMYLRELPEPLIPSRMNYYFIALAKKYSSLLAKDNTNDFKSFDNPVTSSSSRNSTVVPASQADSGPLSANQSALDQQRLAFRRDLTKLVRKLPIENYNLLKYLACFLYRISLKQKYNKMCAEALGIVFGPNVFRIRSESYKGLKEQELSNQIMASIISNYKSIFDCELTDPLGNLKLSTEDLPLMAQDEHGSSKRHPTAVENGKVQSSKLPETSVSPLPSTSVSGSDLQDSYPCTKHEHSCYYHNKPGQLSEEGDDEDEEEDDDDDDDETSGDDEDQIEEADDEQDCDDESYSPSSGSSYCSSAESDSVESTYDDEEEEDENDDGEQVDPEDKYPGEIDSDDMLTDSSSECASDTNYTPSSSHTESDANGDADESPYYRSSSFESSSSFGRQGQNKSEPEGAPTGPLNMAQNQSDNPCRVCKRRESAQIEAHQRSLLEAKFKQASIDQQQQQAVDATSGPETVCDTSTVTSGTQQAALNTSSEVVTLIDDKPDNDATAAAESNRRLKQHNKSSRRRKQPEEPKKFIDQVKRDLISMNKTSSDQTLNQLEKYADKAAATGDDRFSRRNQSRQAHRPNLLRRRSSSASSLLRIKSRNGRLIAKKTFAGKEDHNQHHPPTHHHHKTRMSHSERRKPHELKTYCRKSRKGHQATKRGEQHSSSTRATAKRSTGGWRDTRLPHEQQQQQVERVTSLEPKSFIWDYTPASLIGLQDCDGMFLRSYNSDETLLRTSDNYLDSDNGPERNYPRRFSDHEHLLIRKQVIPVCERFGEIFEALESEGAIDLGNTIDDQDARSRYEQQHHKDGEHSRLATIEASTVSLLDDRMNNFRHSNLSIEENSQDDVVNPVLNQLRSTKDLIKVLKKALKSNDTKLFNLVKLQSDEENRDERSDDWSLCHLDHLSAASLTGQLSAVNDMTENLMNDEEQNQFKAMINTKLNLLKERYNSTRIIHDHYTKHHLPDEVSKSNQEQHDDRSVNVESTKHQPIGNKRSALSIQENSDLGSSSESLTQMAKLTLAELEVETKLSCSSPSASPEQRNHLVCKFGSLCPVEFVFKIEKQLALKQSSSNRLIKLNEMNSDQLQSEKLELQKNLLRFEHWFGRPSTRLEFQLTGHLYERYRAVKMLKQNRQP